LVVIKTILYAVLAKLTVTQAVKNSSAIKTTQRFNGTFTGSFLWPLVMNQLNSVLILVTCFF